MKIYLDTCCYNRPFDGQSHDRIRLETEAVISIIHLCEAGQHQLIGSNALEFEFTRIRDEDKRKKVLLLYRACAYKIKANEDIRIRADVFAQCNIQPLDALHLALAEYAESTLISTDDKFLKAAAKATSKIKALNPVDWLMEVSV